MGEVKRQTLSGVKWSAIEKLSIQGIQFVIGVILARLLSPADFGLVGMITIFLSISQSIIDSGFANALIRKLDRSQTDCSTAFYFNVVMGVLMVGIMYALSPFIASFFNEPLLTDLTRAVSLTLFINSLSIVQTALFTAKIDFKSQARATIIATVVSGGLGITLAYLGYGVWSLVYQQVCSALLRCMLFWLYSAWSPTWEFSWLSFKDLFSYGSKLMLSGLLGTVYHHASTIIIGKFYTPVDLGYYTRGSQFAHLPNQTIVGILNRVTFPILSKLQNDDEKLINVYRKYIKLTSMAIFPMLILMAALAKPIILLLLTAKWLPAIIYLQLFCLAILTGHIAQINLNLLQVKGRSDLCLKLEIIKKTISISLMLLAIPYGVLAICISVVVYSQISLFLNTYYTGKLFKLGYWQQAKDFLPYLLLSIIACIPGYLLTLISMSSILNIVVGFILAILLYYIMLKISKDILFEEYVNVPIKKFIYKYKNI